jgi:Acetyltransferases
MSKMSIFSRIRNKKKLLNDDRIATKDMLKEELRYHSVRKIEPSEIKKAMDISQKSLSERYSKELMHEIYSAWPEGFSVYATEADILGFLAGKRTTHNEARILMLATIEKYRSLGIGGKLIEKFLQECRYFGIVTVRLEVRTDNKKGYRVLPEARFYRYINFEKLLQ